MFEIVLPSVIAGYFGLLIVSFLFRTTIFVTDASEEQRQPQYSALSDTSVMGKFGRTVVSKVFVRI